VLATASAVARSGLVVAECVWRPSLAEESVLERAERLLQTPQHTQVSLMMMILSIAFI
jgi:hypothetical protein